MEPQWNSYICNVNNALASILVDLALKKQAPIPSKDWLLWIWLYMRTPRPDGLSHSDEAPVLFQIEDKLSEQLGSRFGALLSGRITTSGRREFYFYGEHQNGLAECVANVLTAFPGYKFDCDAQREANWNQYLNVLYPSEEELQRMANRDVLESLKRQGDNHSVVREVSHRILFPTDLLRSEFLMDAQALGYKIQTRFDNEGVMRFGADIYRNQPVTSEAIDHAVIELFRLANRYKAEYDGWGTTVEKE